MPRSARRLCGAVTALALTAPTSILAHKVPVGPSFQVNTYTAGHQGGVSGYRSCGYQGGRGQAVAADAAGGFVVVWSDGAGPYSYGGEIGHGRDGSYRGIFGQRFDSGGNRVGPEFQVNTRTLGDQSYPRVAMRSTGEFVVVWNAQYVAYDGGDAYPTGYRFAHVRGQRYDDEGTPQGGEFNVAGDASSLINRYPAVAMDDGGRFVVVWDTNEYSYGGQIHGRRYDGDGSPLGSRFRISTLDYPGGYSDESPDVAMEPGGEFVVAWKAYPQGYCQTTYSILTRRYDGAGNPLGGEVAVGTDVCENGYFEVFPRLARTGGGGFVVVWASSSLDAEVETDGDATDIVARRVGAGGSPIGDVFRVNTTTAGHQRCAAVAGAGDGSFVVTWTQVDTRQGFGQQFDRTGAPAGGEFFVNPQASQGYVAHGTSIAATPSGDFVVVWTDLGYSGPLGIDGDALGVFAQRFGDPPVPCSPTPAIGCKRQTRSGAGVFRFKGQASSPNRNRLLWRWAQGNATVAADFGDPFAVTDYALCVYDSSANAQPLIAARAEAASTCGSFPCWRLLSGTGPPIEYFDRPSEQGGSSNPDGLRRIRLRPGAAGRASASAEGRGQQLTLPALPLTPPVTVQLQASNGSCWTSTYDGFITDNGVAANGSGLFQAKPSLP
jgi:hypothetical protein